MYIFSIFTNKLSNIQWMAKKNLYILITSFICPTKLLIIVKIKWNKCNFVFFIRCFYTFLFNTRYTIFCKFALCCPVWDIDQLIAVSILSPIANEVTPCGSGVDISWDCSRLDRLLFDIHSVSNSYPCVHVRHLLHWLLYLTLVTSCIISPSSK